MDQCWQYGPQRLRFIPPLIIIDAEGAVTAEESRALLAKIGELELGHKACGLLVIAGTGFSITADARRHLVSTSGSKRPVIPLAVVGTSVVTRTLFTLLLNAIRLTTRKRVPVAFFSTESEARKWIVPLIQARAAALGESSA